MQTAPAKTKKATTAARVVKAVKDVIVRYFRDDDKNTRWATVKSFETRDKLVKQFNNIILKDVTFLSDNISELAKLTGCRVAAKGTPVEVELPPLENAIQVYAYGWSGAIMDVYNKELSGCEFLYFNESKVFAFNPTYLTSN